MTATYCVKDRKPVPGTYTCRAGRCHSFAPRFSCPHGGVAGAPPAVSERVRMVRGAGITPGVDVDGVATRVAEAVETTLAAEILRPAANALRRREAAADAAFGSRGYRATRHPLG